MHTFGDKGYLMMLDAFEQANREDSILGRGFGLDHGMMVSPEIVEKSAKLDVIWSLQPPMFYTTYAAAVSRVYCQEIAHRWMLPVKSLIDAGVRVTYGADTHDDPQRQPLFNLEVLVTRRVKDGRIFGPREAIDRATALLMMTRWGADYVLRSEELGSLEAGKLADLVILDKNPLDRNVPDEDLSEITVVATLIGGKVIYGSLNPEQ
jgi:predicted amidohydrolase YtcJ